MLLPLPAVIVNMDTDTTAMNSIFVGLGLNRTATFDGTSKVVMIVFFNSISGHS